jgi:predicted thioesterase
MDLTPGRCAEVELVVGEADTASALGSGDVPVLGTPRLVALAEAACVAAVATALAPGETTVGTRVEHNHTSATPVGVRVTARATLSYVDGRTLHFDVAATDAAGRSVADGTVTRMVVDRDRFVARAQMPVVDRG